MSITNLTPAQLRKAASIVERIEKLQNQLNQIVGEKSVSVVEAGDKPARKRRKFSAAGLERIRQAQKIRWAKVHAAKNK